MTSAINPAYPVEGNPTTESVRDNFAAAKTEIEDLQTDKQDTLESGVTIKTIAGKNPLGSGNLAITKEDVGLPNVDNTSDANKPVSTPQAASIGAAQAAANAYTEGEIALHAADERAHLTAMQKENPDITATAGVGNGKIYDENGKELLQNKVIRGVSQAMNVTTEGFNGATGGWSRTHRTPHYLNTRFKRFKIVLPCFYTDGSNYDALLTEDYQWQVGFEENYLAATSGIPARKPITFDGVGIATYLAASPPSSGYIVSDWVECDNWVEAGQKFGFWTTIEAAARSGDNKVPYTRNASNFFQRYMGTISASGVSQINANSAITATSISPSTSSQSGASAYYTPAMMLIETDDASIEFIAIIGSSIPNGIGEGANGSGTFGDTMGSALGNRGFIERGIMEVAQSQIAVQVSKGSQNLTDFIDPDHWKYRRALVQLANPTVAINGLNRNDVAGTQTVPTRQTSTAYNKYDDVRAGGTNSYVALAAGTTSATGTFTPTGEANVDGTVIWKWLGVFSGTGTQAPVVIGDMMVVNQQIKSVCPDAKLFGILPTLGTTSSDSFLTTANQTLRTNFDQPNGKRSIVYQLMYSLKSYLGYYGLIDVNAAIEDGGANSTGKWICDGVATFYSTADGVHPNSRKHYDCSLLITSSIFAV